MGIKFYGTRYYSILKNPSIAFWLWGVCVEGGDVRGCGEAAVRLTDPHLKVSIIFLQLLIGSVVRLDMVFLISHSNFVVLFENMAEWQQFKNILSYLLK